MGDPAAVAVLAHRRLTSLEKRAAEQIAIRAEAIAALRADGWSYGRIAKLLGVSRGRIPQIVTPK